MTGTVSFTGHHHIPEAVASDGIDAVLSMLQPLGVYVGGAAGADTLAAERCLAHDMPYVMVLPHRYYIHQYKLDGSPRWERTFLGAEQVVYVVEDKPWHFSHNFTRNIWMVDRSELLVSISKFDPFGEIPKRGGTAHCVRYARKVKRPIKWVDISEGSVSAARLF